MIRHREPKGARVRRGVEPSLRAHETSDLAQHRLELVTQRFGAGRQPHLVAIAHEERIAEELAQATQRMARGGLTARETLRRARDAALGEQRLERDEEVEIEVAQLLHGVARIASTSSTGASSAGR